MALKTQPTKVTPASLFASLPAEQQRDAKALLKLFQTVTGEKPVVWGSNLIGFGTYTYGKPVKTFFRTGFAMRASAISLYVSCNAKDRAAFLARLGMHKAAVGCVYIKRLADVDQTVLANLIAASYRDTQSC